MTIPSVPIQLVPEEDIMSEEDRIKDIKERNKRENYLIEGWNKYERPIPITPKDECCNKVCLSLNEYINFMEKEEDRKYKDLVHKTLEGSPVFIPRRDHKKIAYGIDSLDKFRDHLEKTKICKCKNDI